VHELYIRRAVDINSFKTLKKKKKKKREKELKLNNGRSTYYFIMELIGKFCHVAIDAPGIFILHFKTTNGEQRYSFYR
jgi:hypothetical protein